ncbi:MAG: 30S ribosomal protein S12 methylthiotransferase RimO [Coriobacteriia bacterium]
MRTVRVAFETLGCPKNEVDADRMAASVAASAYGIAADADDADVIVLSTCAFVREAVEESVERALELAVIWRAARRGRHVIVAGCLPSRYGRELETALPEADAFVPVAGEAGLLDVIERLTGIAAEPSAGPVRTASGPVAYLMVADGCHRACAYCTIPAIRGPYRSRSSREILAEARVLVESGARELVLVGQDVSAWGRDLPGAGRLSGLVRDLGRVDGLDRLRLMYLQPDGVTEDLLDAMASVPSVCRYLDIPLQHASRSVLRRMGRSGDGEGYLDLLQHVRDALPGAALRTTFIAGFPGETRAEARELEDFARAARFDFAGVFAYSREDGTRAASMEGQVTNRTRTARAQRLRDICDAIGFEIAASRVDSVVEVLVDGEDEDGATVGRTCGQAPEVDGVVSLDASAVPGEILRARIVDSAGYDLFGEVIGC